MKHFKGFREGMKVRVTVGERGQFDVGEIATLVRTDLDGDWWGEIKGKGLVCLTDVGMVTPNNKKDIEANKALCLSFLLKLLRTEREKIQAIDPDEFVVDTAIAELISHVKDMYSPKGR